MSVLINKDTEVIYQDFAGNRGVLHPEQTIAYDTQMIGGMTPGKGGAAHPGLPVFNTMHRAVETTSAIVTVIYIPTPLYRDSTLKTTNMGIKLTITTAEGIPMLDMLTAKVKLDGAGVRMVDPNCPGVTTLGKCRVDITPGHIHKPNKVDIISRSGTLTYEAVKQTTDYGFDRSTCVGIDGGPIPGSNFIGILKPSWEDPRTEAIVVIGEIGDSAEEEVTACIKEHVAKPVVGYIAGVTTSKGKHMGHVGTIIAGGKGTADEKFTALEAASAKAVRSLADIGKTLKAIIG